MSARTGLRYGELSELVWGDIVLDEEKSHTLARASISKNKKEARIRLIAELEHLLSDFKPEGAKPMESSTQGQSTKMHSIFAKL